MSGPKHSTSVPFSAEVAVPLSVEEKEGPLVGSNPVTGVALKSLLGPAISSRCGSEIGYMWQGTQAVTTTHSPDCDPIHTINITCEVEGITRTDRGRCNKLPSNMTWRIFNTHIYFT